MRVPTDPEELSFLTYYAVKSYLSDLDKMVK